MVERYRLIDGDTAKQAAERHEKDHGRVGPGASGVAVDPGYKGKGLQVQFTVDDPGVFTVPWSAASTYRRASSAWVEDVCAENPRDYAVEHDTKLVPSDDTPDF